MKASIFNIMRYCVHDGNKRTHPQGVDEFILNVTVPNKSSKTSKWRLRLCSRTHRGQTAVCGNYEKSYNTGKR